MTDAIEFERRGEMVRLGIVRREWAVVVDFATPDDLRAAGYMPITDNPNHVTISSELWSQAQAAISERDDLRQKLEQAELEVARLREHDRDVQAYKQLNTAQRADICDLQEKLTASEKRATEAERLVLAITRIMDNDGFSVQEAHGRIRDALSQYESRQRSDAPSHPFEAPSVAETKSTLEERVAALEAWRQAQSNV